MKEKKKLADIIRDAETEIILLVIGYTALPLTIILLFVYDTYAKVPMSCGLRELAGMYCPGCGGTRAMWGFFTGHFLTSFYYHPFVPYAMVMYIVFMIRNTLHVIRPQKFKLMEIRSEYAIIALVIIMVQFFIKNILALGFGIYLN